MTAAEFAAATRPEREAAEQRAGEERVLRCLALMAEQDGEGRGGATRSSPWRRPGSSWPRSPRRCAAAHLAPALRRGAAGPARRRRSRVPPLLKRAIEDPEATVRAAAADALRAIGEPSTVDAAGRALDSRYADVRVRAAEALARLLGDEVGAPYVIRRWEARSGDFPRVYFATSARSPTSRTSTWRSRRPRSSRTPSWGSSRRGWCRR